MSDATSSGLPMGSDNDTADKGIDDWNPNKFMTYRFISDFAVITFTVPGMADWSEEQWDDVAQTDLTGYVTESDAYYLDDCWENANV